MIRSRSVVDLILGRSFEVLRQSVKKVQKILVVNQPDSFAPARAADGEHPGPDQSVVDQVIERALPQVRDDLSLEMVMYSGSRVLGTALAI